MPRLQQVACTGYKLESEFKAWIIVQYAPKKTACKSLEKGQRIEGITHTGYYNKILVVLDSKPMSQLTFLMIEYKVMTKCTLLHFES